ncbi:PolC-type DNA polymerase III [Latilactobacillus fuchuensis]|uniref:PolC-type DNA polymerase III n=1 Tax=Latilactobacillus fuchuensis TaxID=164393 RepID=UPI0039AFEA8D
MALDQTALFQKLLEQIELPADVANYPGFKTGQVEQVIVHETSKAWTFKLHFETVLPYAVFVTFEQYLEAAFKSIATVQLAMTTDKTELDGGVLAAYWEYVVNHSGIQSSLLHELCAKETPYMDGKQTYLVVENDIVKNFFINQAQTAIQDGYRRLGFPKFAIQPLIDESASQKAIEDFQAKKAVQDAARAQAAAEAIKKNEALKEKRQAEGKPVDGPISMGRGLKPDEPARQMITINEEERSVVIEGYVFDKEVRVLRSGRQLLILKMTDYSSSFTVKKFSRDASDEGLFAAINPGMWFKVRGSVQEDNFLRDLVLNANDLVEVSHPKRQDTAENGKRVELHLHTNMSQMDATNKIGDFVKQAASWGQSAIAVTDHYNLQSFPDAYAAGKKNNVKILYGVEVNLVNDGTPVAYNLRDEVLETAEYVIFDVETTGLSAVYDSIIELAAVKMKNGEVVASFDEFINPGKSLSAFTTQLTSITNEMVQDAKSEAAVLAMFKDFAGDAVLAGHNVTFDMGFLNAGYGRNELGQIENPVIDTLELSRMLHPEYKNHKLDSLTKRYKINLEHHHRANADAESTGYLLYKLETEAATRYEMLNVNQLNNRVGEGDSYKQARPAHAVLMAKTQAGLKNLFKLVSASMTEYYYRTPRLPKSRLDALREGIIVGSACSSGEVFEAMMQKGYEEARSRAKYYDYIEVMPKAVYAPLLERELVQDEKALEEIIANLVKLGAELGKPVVATGDAHYLNPVDSIYRKILINSMGGANPLNRSKLPDVHFRSTDEMLKAFAFLGADKAQEIVVTNPNALADSLDEIVPVKDKLYTPKMEGAEDEIQTLTMNRAHELYGAELPAIVQERLDKELKSIIGNGFSVIYLISQKLVYKSGKDGYLVGSRGSVGSSLVATMTGITEVNPLPPHYRCPNCHYSEFYTKGEVGSGYDLDDKNCPKCDTPLDKDGHDIPFETFLGFHGDKVPDIDLNFSGDYQSVAHNYTKVLFGENNVFRAGTIGTVADKTAYGYVKAYERDTEQTFRGAEIDRLAKGSTGVKRTTGQHPAGIIVVPDYMDIYDFTPIQFPADDQDAAWKTTHFDFHSIHDNILKLDILGHDDPTMIRMLQDLSGINPKTIPTDDPGVMALFSGTDSLDVTPEQINSKMGTLGVPEFGTRFVRGMLEETHPTTFSELLQISGLSHGTDVWLGNAEELINKGVVTLKDVIGCRDNIMMDLIHWGMDDSIAFNIMERVRKGKGIPDDWQQAMRENENVPDWYIDSCLKIKYMFPKAHATAYIMMALRIAYFKVYFPIIYYCTYFSVRADDFDLVAMAQGKEGVKARMKEITDKGMEASTKEKNLLTVLEIANECLERGVNIKMVDVEKSDSANFLIQDDHTLLAPFRAVPGLGDNVAKQIVSAREEKPFLSKEDLSNRGKVSKTLIEYMTVNNVLSDLPDENQLSLFDMM